MPGYVESDAYVVSKREQHRAVAWVRQVIIRIFQKFPTCDVVYAPSGITPPGYFGHLRGYFPSPSTRVSSGNNLQISGGRALAHQKIESLLQHNKRNRHACHARVTLVLFATTKDSLNKSKQRVPQCFLISLPAEPCVRQTGMDSTHTTFLCENTK